MKNEKTSQKVEYESGQNETLVIRYFIDTEFIEIPNTIELISIGIKSSDGRKYYAISSEFDPDNADKWVKENVIDILEEDVERKPISVIKEELTKFIIDGDKEFWGYYSDYDWVVFCWIFGKMIDLPKGFPMYCKDLKQMMDEKELGKDWKRVNCPDPIGEHNALVDAEWNEKLYSKILGV